MAPVLRRATERVAPAAAGLILETTALEAILGDRDAARRAAEAAYLAERTELSHRFGMLAEEEGRVLGLAVAFPGRLYGSLKLGTGVVLARSAGARHVRQVVARARALDRLLPSVPATRLHVSVLAVDPLHRRRGIATALMERIVAGGRRLGLDVSLDVDLGNEAARKLAEGFGFRVEQETEASEVDRQTIALPGFLRLVWSR